MERKSARFFLELTYESKKKRNCSDFKAENIVKANFNFRISNLLARRAVSNFVSLISSKEAIFRVRKLHSKAR